jgi:hypothetical protein
MKSTILFTGILLASLTANASSMWQLAHSEFHEGSFFCTYRYASYETTIVQKNACPQFIQR